ncbi:MAG: hypothetical protein MK116_10575 [Phycisphaerales bacterium]|nr:hypothetical protein [Phycisphaerales bacterium]
MASSRGARRGAAVLGGIVLTLMGLTLALYAIDYLYDEVPRFMVIFSDFDAELPGFALWLAAASEWTSQTGQAPLNMPLWLSVLAIVIAIAGVVSIRRPATVIVLATVFCVVQGSLLYIAVSMMQNYLLILTNSALNTA